MKLMTKEIAEKLPKLRSTESQEDPMAVVKYFDPSGSWTWYVTEGEQIKDDNDNPTGDWLFFGLVIGWERELGYFRLSDLQDCKKGLKGIQALPIERDLYWEPTKISECK